jgi:hypothetical protein
MYIWIHLRALKRAFFVAFLARILCDHHKGKEPAERNSSKPRQFQDIKLPNASQPSILLREGLTSENSSQRHNETITSILCGSPEHLRQLSVLISRLQGTKNRRSHSSEQGIK